MILDSMGDHSRASTHSSSGAEAENMRTSRRNHGGDPVERSLDTIKTKEGRIAVWECLLVLTIASWIAYAVGYKVRCALVEEARVLHGSATFLAKEHRLSEAKRTRQVVKVAVSPSSPPSSCETPEQGECLASPFRQVTVDRIRFTKAFGHDLNAFDREFKDFGYVERQSVFEEEDDDEEEEEDDEEDDKVDPSGVMLKVDMEFLSSHFLGSIAALQRALLDVVWDESWHRELGLTDLLCHSAETDTSPVTCSAILTGGNYLHLSSFPEKGLINLSGFIPRKDGSEDGLHLSRLFHKYFGVAASNSQVVRMGWKAEHVGRAHPPFATLITEDLAEFFSTAYRLPHKAVVINEVTDFQSITVVDMVDVLDTNLEAYESLLIPPLGGSSSYVARNPELFRSKRVLCMDGMMQSTSRGDAPYHETLVHPAMMAHPTGPRRVAIVGGGEGATLREVLKHRTVEKCIMIEIDPGIVRISRRVLPEWNNCTDFSSADGGNDVNCFDHPKAELRFEDAFAWFANHFGSDATLKTEEPLDLIIMDALDPEGNAEIAANLYRNQRFWTSMKNALTEDGIMVMQMGSAPSNVSPAETYSRWHHRDAFLETIEIVGFQTMFIFVESHSDFELPWAFLVACKSTKCEKNWFASTAAIQVLVHQRIFSRSDGQPSVRFFDGPFLSTLQRPPRPWESVYCRKEPRPVECDVVETYPKNFGRDNIRDAADLRILSKLAYSINASTHNIRNVTRSPSTVATVRPSISHLSSPTAKRHETLLLTQELQTEGHSVEALLFVSGNA